MNTTQQILLKRECLEGGQNAAWVSILLQQKLLEREGKDLWYYSSSVTVWTVVKHSIMDIIGKKISEVLLLVCLWGFVSLLYILQFSFMVPQSQTHLTKTALSVLCFGRKEGRK